MFQQNGGIFGPPPDMFTCQQLANIRPATPISCTQLDLMVAIAGIYVNFTQHFIDVAS